MLNFSGNPPYKTLSVAPLGIVVPRMLRVIPLSSFSPLIELQTWLSTKTLSWKVPTGTKTPVGPQRGFAVTQRLCFMHSPSLKQLPLQPLAVSCIYYSRPLPLSFSEPFISHVTGGSLQTHPAGSGASPSTRDL